MNSLISENWKSRFDDFVDEAPLDELKRIISIFPTNNLEPELKQLFNRAGASRDSIRKGFARLVAKEYSTFLFPAILTQKRAPNFWLEGEPPKPKIDEAWKAAYLLLSSVRIWNHFFNLDNIADKGRQQWRSMFVTESKGSAMKTFYSDLGIRSLRPSEHLFYLTLAILAYFAYQIKAHADKPDKLDMNEFRNEAKRKWSLSDDTVLMVYVVGQRQKKQTYVFSGLSDFMTKWFSDMITSKETDYQRTALTDFLESLGFSAAKNDISSNLREKLIHDLLQYGQINGKALSDLISLKIETVFSSSTKFGLARAHQLMSLL